MKNWYKKDGDTLIVYIQHKGELIETYFDAEDFDHLDSFPNKLTLTNMGYVAHSKMIKGVRDNTLLHRTLIDVPEGLVIDHIDRNPRNNRKSNLRAVTTYENNLNSPNTKNHTGEKYISIDKRGYYFVLVRRKGFYKSSRFKHLGDAIAFRDNILKELGEL